MSMTVQIRERKGEGGWKAKPPSDAEGLERIRPFMDKVRGAFERLEQAGKVPKYVSILSLSFQTSQPSLVDSTCFYSD